MEQLLRRFSLLVTVGAASCAANVSMQDRADPPPPTPDPDASLFLVGDAGFANPTGHAMLRGLGAEVRAAAATVPHVAVVFLGDNVYEEGIRAEHVEEDRQKLEPQLDVLRGAGANVAGYFVPGNHDWGDGAGFLTGLAAVERQEAIAEAVPGVTFRPDPGCPGPDAVTLGRHATLLFLDSELLIRRRAGGACEVTDADSTFRRLDALLAAHADRQVVVMAHHPLTSGGLHGGNHSPIIVPYYLFAAAGGVVQDLNSPRYASMRRRLDAAFEHPPTAPLLYAAGHEHTLQVVDRSAVDQSGPRPMELVSGTGSRGSKLRDFEGLVYGTVRHGYMRVDFFEGRARLRVMALRDPDTSSFRMVYWCDLPYDGRTACPAVPR